MAGGKSGLGKAKARQGSRKSALGINTRQKAGLPASLVVVGRLTFVLKLIGMVSGIGLLQPPMKSMLTTRKITRSPKAWLCNGVWGSWSI